MNYKDFSREKSQLKQYSLNTSGFSGIFEGKELENGVRKCKVFALQLSEAKYLIVVCIKTLKVSGLI